MTQPSGNSGQLRLGQHDRDNKACALDFLTWRVSAWKADGHWDTFPRGERIHVLRNVARLRRELGAGP